jgi:hypothetical protein
MLLKMLVRESGKMRAIILVMKVGFAAACRNTSGASAAPTKNPELFNTLFDL